MVPYWTTQPRFSKLARLLTVFLSYPGGICCHNLLFHPTLSEQSLPNMRLLACWVSGREQLQSRGLSEQATKILLSSWRQGPKFQYMTYIKTWKDYRGENSNKRMSSSLQAVEEFLTVFYNQELGYSTINTERSALSTFIVSEGKPVGRHPLVIRFLKGLFLLRLALLRNTVTWDTDVVLCCLKTISPVKALLLKCFIFKLATLLAFLPGQRAQTLSLLDIRNITLCRYSAKCMNSTPQFRKHH